MSLVVPDTLERADWRGASGSTLTHHGACCERARAWLLGMARSHDFASSDGLAFAGPRWLTHRFQWGPTRWPVAWCEAIEAPQIDCGVFAAFALEILRKKGLEAYPAQVLRTYAKESAVHWRRKWSAMPGGFDWIGVHTVFHEVCLVRSGPREARVYDPTDGIWLEASVRGGHGAHSAIRADIPVALAWGSYTLVSGQWTELEAAV